MSLNTPETEPGRDEEAEGSPQDGRNGQPVTEGSSDDPRTLNTMDPLRDEQREVDESSGLGAIANGTLPDRESERVAAEAKLEGPEGAWAAAPVEGAIVEPAGTKVEQPADVAGQEAGGRDVLGRPLPDDAPDDENI
jgi:hypothetical protein